jgi:hypothetical protein
VPRTGPLVEQFYGTPEDEETEEYGPPPEDLVFFSDRDDPGSALTAMVWAVGKALGYDWPSAEVTLDDVFRHGMVLVVEPESGMYQATEEGESVDIMTGLRTSDVPTNVEPGDIWSREGHIPSQVVTGDNLLHWLAKVNPSYYKSLEHYRLRQKPAN